MAVPSIMTYPMPRVHELPTNTADWKIEPDRAILLLHDMQEYFLQPFAAGESPLRELVQNAVKLRQRCTALGMPVAYTAQPGGMTTAQRGLLADFWGSGMTAAPADRRVTDAVAPDAADWMLTKWRYSAFYQTDLLDRMRACGRDQIIVAGVYAHVGVLMTTCDAFTFDIEPFLVADAVADFSAAYHRLALDYAAQRCAMVTSTNQVLSELANAASAP